MKSIRKMLWKQVCRGRLPFKIYKPLYLLFLKHLSFK
jgi:hypothetical protein